MVPVSAERRQMHTGSRALDTANKLMNNIQNHLVYYMSNL